LSLGRIENGRRGPNAARRPPSTSKNEQKRIDRPALSVARCWWPAHALTARRFCFVFFLFCFCFVFLFVAPHRPFRCSSLTSVHCAPRSALNDDTERDDQTTDEKKTAPCCGRVAPFFFNGAAVSAVMAPPLPVAEDDIQRRRNSRPIVWRP